ncbi:MAG: HAD family hydrolase [Vulcanisaeta sp.]|uniref:HAD family hydrolase n=1 Tax=Vulcanisaeta sp. TaxID=2020871 RepID=UPI003D142178
MLILIDLDGTLLPLEAWDPVFQDVSMLIASKVNVDWRVIHNTAKDLNKELLREFTVRAFDWDYIFTEVARRFGVPMSIDVNTVLVKYVRDFKPFNGALELLSLIRELGHRIVIATNGLYKYQSVVIEELGFSKFIDGIRTPDMIGCPKNCREFFSDAQVMIGDNPLFDVYYPLMFGLTTIFIGDWHKRLRYVMDIWGIDLSSIKPTYSFKDVQEVLMAIPKILNSNPNDSSL